MRGFFPGGVPRASDLSTDLHGIHDTADLPVMTFYNRMDDFGSPSSKFGLGKHVCRYFSEQSHEG